MNDIPLMQPLVEAATVHRVFEECASRSPGNVAVCGESAQLTYREVHEIAGKCAAAVRRQTAGQQGPVAICLHDSTRLPALFLGVMQSGRPYVYIDPADPPALRESTIGKTGAALLIADHGVRFSGVRSVGIDEVFALENDGLETDGPSTQGLEEDPCCLMHTGGTTGQSRCVSISHRALLHNIANFRHTLGITPEDRLSLLASPKFVAANSAIYGALLGGACLCPFDLKTRGFLAWVAWLRRARITILHTTPSLFRLLARHVKQKSFPHLRAVKLGGEPLYRADVELFKARFHPRCVLVNGLGMSEAGGNICHHVIPRDSHLQNEGEIVTVGRALPGHGIVVVDEMGRPVAAGGEGEIRVRSAFLSQGFWNDPGASAAIFRGIAPDSKETELLTGDVGRMLPDGSLVHLGRRDRLIKVRGFRVDLNLVEAAMLASPLVKNAAVSFMELPEHHGMIAACVEPLRKDAADAETLRVELAKTLPDYMVPQRIVFLPELPLTAGGKVDRAKLTGVLEEAPPSPAGADPRSPLERRLVHLWREILKRKRIGIYDNFFELGGDSLQAMEFLSCLSRELGRACSADLLLARPTIAQIAEAAEIGIIEGAGKPPECSVRASLLALRKGGRGAPLVFIPGGYTTENELAVCAGLLPCIDGESPVWGIRLNLVEKNIRRPRAISEIAGQIAAALLRSPGIGHVPVLVGECQACVLALETGRQLAEKTGKSPMLIMLDPWLPRVNPRRQAANHPAAVLRYYRLLRVSRPASYAGRVHLVCCGNSPRGAETCLAWWNSHLQSQCSLHVAPGDHHSFMRLHKQSLARILNAICERGAPEKWPRGFFKRRWCA